MPINERRRDDIATAVAAYDSANPNASLPRNAARLLAVMFPCETPMLSALAKAALEGDLAAKVQALAADPGGRPGGCPGAARARS
jgi:hypothetical protein